MAKKKNRQKTDSSSIKLGRVPRPYGMILLRLIIPHGRG